MPRCREGNNHDAIWKEGSFKCVAGGAGGSSDNHTATVEHSESGVKNLGKKWDKAAMATGYGVSAIYLSDKLTKCFPMPIGSEPY